MRVFVELCYDGGGYHGWQEQPGCRSVQGELTEALRKLLRQPELQVMGCGRTDAGVHADYFVAHFDADETCCPIASLLDEAERTAFRLNGILDPDVAVRSLQQVPDRLHSRFSAKWRTYNYRLTLDKAPLQRGYTFRPYFALDFAQMNAAAATLLGQHDFSSFCKSGTDTKTNLCTVSRAEWVEERPGRVTFVVRADRFLRNMVRAMVGTLFEVGKGRLSVAGLQEVVARRDRCQAGTSVAACGLSLVDVGYAPNCGFKPQFNGNGIK